MDDDCEDQALVATKTCTKTSCRVFGHGQPNYPKLVKRGMFWCCPVCHGSYGTNPHPDLT